MNRWSKRAGVLHHCITTTLMAFASTSLWAQSDLHDGHHMEQHDTIADPIPQNAENHSAHTAPHSSAVIADASAMDHTNMEMGDTSALDDTRDPHAYADGFTRQSNPYTQPGIRPLQLADEHHFGSVLVDRLERVSADDNVTAYDAQAWFGHSNNRLAIKAEGDYVHGKFEESNTQLLYSHATARYWDVQAGLSYNTSSETDRSWLALGIQGLAPYWFEVDATAFLGENGRTAMNVQVEYELFLTQRLIFQPRVEINAYGKNDPEMTTGSGLADAAAGFRVRYEFSRQFAPYVGIELTRKFGKTANYVEVEGGSSRDTLYLAGVRFWY